MRSRGFAMWILGLALLLTAACTASRPPTPTPPPASEGGAAEATQPPTPTPEPSPTETPEPTPTPTEKPTRTPELTPTPAIDIWQEVDLPKEYLQYAVPIATLELPPTPRSPEEIAQELLSIQGEAEFRYHNIQPGSSIDKFFKSPYEQAGIDPIWYTLNIANDGKISPDEEKYRQRIQEAVIKVHRNVDLEHFAKSYLLSPDETGDYFRELGLIPALEKMLELMQAVGINSQEWAVEVYVLGTSKLHKEYTGFDQSNRWLYRLIWQLSKPSQSSNNLILKYIGEIGWDVLYPPLFDPKTKQTAILDYEVQNLHSIDLETQRTSQDFVAVRIVGTNGTGVLFTAQTLKGRNVLREQVIGGLVLDAQGNVLYQFGEIPEEFDSMP